MYFIIAKAILLAGILKYQFGDFHDEIYNVTSIWNGLAFYVNI